MDCYYCHYTVDKSSHAAVPPTEVCMNCHTRVKATSPRLEKVRGSYETGKPIEWVRVHRVPDYVFFNHQAHVKAGVSCVSCHGRVDHMPLMWQEATLQMEWCLNCHRNPANFVRPREEVFNMAYQAPSGADQLELGLRLKKEYNVADTKHMTSCSVCHR